MQKSGRYIPAAGKDRRDDKKDQGNPESTDRTDSRIKLLGPLCLPTAAAAAYAVLTWKSPFLIVYFGAGFYHAAKWTAAGAGLAGLAAAARSCAGYLADRHRRTRLEENAGQKGRPVTDARLLIGKEAGRCTDEVYRECMRECCEDLERIEDLGSRYRKLIADNTQLQGYIKEQLDPVILEAEEKAADRGRYLLNYITAGNRDAVIGWSEKMHGKNLVQIGQMEDMLRAIADYMASASETDDVDIASYVKGIRSTFED